MLKIVHINTRVIKNEAEVTTLAQVLRSKWERRARRQAEKMFADYQNSKKLNT